MRGAMRAANLPDIETNTCMSVKTSFSILHFFEDDIIGKANRIGVTLGANSLEVARSVNDLLDLEVDRAMSMLKSIAATKPMNEREVDDMGVRSLECLCK